jgi:hypothetical protein
MKKTYRSIFGVCAAALVVGGVCATSHASVVTLQDGNTVTTINEATGDVMSLSVGGVSQVVNQSLFYSVNSGTPQSFNTLDDSVNEVASNTLFLNYVGSNFTAQVGYILAGGASPSQSAQLVTNVLIQGNSQAAKDLPQLSVSLYEYDHLQLDNNPKNKVVANANGVFQSEVGGVGTTASVTPQGDEYEVGLSPAVFNSLSAPVTLNDNGGPVTGNVEFAMETDQPNLTSISQLFAISTETFNPGVPVPPAVWMGLTTLLGIGGIAAVRRSLAKA